MSTTLHRFEVQGVHRQLMACRDPEVLHVGMAGTGKTLAAAAKMHYSAMAVPEMRGLMLRATQTSLTATTLVTFQKEVAARALEDGTMRWFGGSPKQPPGFQYSNGSTITVASGERPERLLSLSLDRIMIDEAIEVSIDLYEVLISRLRGTATYKQIICCTNPSHPRHWLKARAESGGMAMFTSTHRDNPYFCLPDGSYTEAGKDYAEKLNRLTGVRRMRLRDGLWVAAEGTVYSDWNEVYHVISRAQLPAFHPNDPVYLCIDFGHTNPMSVIWYRHHRETGRLYAYREIYRTGMLVEDLAQEIRRIEAAHPDEPKPVEIICDHDAEGRATLERHLKRGTRRADKRVITGIEAVEGRLRIGGDGLPRFFVVRDMLMSRDESLEEAKKPCGLMEEIPGYVWQRSATGVKEAPVKLNDHSMDNLRYMVMFLDGAPPSKILSPSRQTQPTSAGALLSRRVA